VNNKNKKKNYSIMIFFKYYIFAKVNLRGEILIFFIMGPPLGGAKKGGGVAFFFGNSQRKRPPPLFDPPKGGPMILTLNFTVFHQKKEGPRWEWLLIVTILLAKFYQ